MMNTLPGYLRRGLGGLVLGVFSHSHEQVRVRLFMATTCGGAAENAQSGPIGTIFHLALSPTEQAGCYRGGL